MEFIIPDIPIKKLGAEHDFGLRLRRDAQFPELELDAPVGEVQASHPIEAGCVQRLIEAKGEDVTSVLIATHITAVRAVTHVRYEERAIGQDGEFAKIEI